jgi:hypothetical protein
VPGQHNEVYPPSLNAMQKRGETDGARVGRTCGDISAEIRRVARKKVCSHFFGILTEYRRLQTVVASAIRMVPAKPIPNAPLVLRRAGGVSF